jgi:hypothetical protein
MGFGRTLLDWTLYLAALALGGALLYYSVVLPNARRAERLERRGNALERDVDGLAKDVERLRVDVVALQSDPYTIERTMKAKVRKLRPDLLEKE